MPWYGAFVCPPVFATEVIHGIMVPELILYLKERMPCIGLCVDHGTEPGLVHFCDFLAFPLQLCLRTFVCN